MADVVSRPVVVPPPITCTDVYTVMLLLLINFTTFADRFTVPSLLPQIQSAFKQEEFGIIGLLQLSFIGVYIFCLPLFGYLGDRINRRLLLSIGLFIWASSGLFSYLVSPAWPHAFWIFLTLRALTGVGQASCIAIGPALLSDLFNGRRRTFILFLYQTEMILGCGVGYLAAPIIYAGTGTWNNALLIWPIVVFLCLVGILLIKEPQRGQSEATPGKLTSSFLADVKYLLRIKSFAFASLGYAGIIFVIGTFWLWGPRFVERQIRLFYPERHSQNIRLLFVFLLMVGGVIGCFAGMLTSKLIQRVKMIGKSTDAVTSAFGAILSAACICLATTFYRYSVIGMWAFLFISSASLFFNAVSILNIVLDVVVPCRRASATAVLIFISQVLGDAICPYITGGLMVALNEASESAARVSSQKVEISVGLRDLTAWQSVVYVTVIVCMFAAFWFYCSSLHVRRDKEKAKSMATSMS